MRRTASLIAAALLPACFYSDPINDRPSADINQVDPDLPYRGESIHVEPYIVDPNGDPTYADWGAFACNNQLGELDCDPLPYDTGTNYGFAFDAPTTTVLGSPATVVHIELDVTDEYGAKAAPRQMLDLPLADHDPEFATPQRSGYDFEDSWPVGLPVKIVMSASDLDDSGTLAFVEPPELFSPPGVPQTDATLVRLDSEDDDSEATWELTANTIGEWIVRVEVRDPIDDPADETERHRDVVDVPVLFAADKQPCIGVTEPAFPPEGASVILDALRRFSVLTVIDDRDTYPDLRPGPAQYFGLADFRWFLDGQLLAVDGNFVDLDPSLYAPGTVLDLRVEAVDRTDQPLCDSALESCEDRTGCFQRRSWSVEVR